MLTTRAVNTLLYRRERQQAERVAVEGDALVFTNWADKSTNPSHLLSRSFKLRLKRAGLPDTTFHAVTRHTCCCILL